MRILTDSQETLLKDERQYLNDLRLLLSRLEAAAEDQEVLADSIRQLDELFLLVVVGEFNAGKSAFINALLGRRLLLEGVTPTTTGINILRYGENQDRWALNNQEEVLSLPVKWLERISIVDTPGTNAIIRAHEAITSHFVPRSDLVLFITSADRPFTESERLFLEKIRNWGKKVVIIINKIDILQSANDLEQIQQFVLDNARQLLGIKPEVFPVSSRLALRARGGEAILAVAASGETQTGTPSNPEPTEWEKSRFAPLEAYIHDTLDESSRLRLKFLNPLGVAVHLLDKYGAVNATRQDLLKGDLQTLTDVEAQMNIYKEDMRRDFKFRLADVENVLFEMEARGNEYFDETFRLGRVFDLLSKERIRSEFEHKVVADAPQRIETRVNEMIDWLVDADLRQWQAVNEHLAERRRQHQDRIVGEAGMAGFNYDRERLIDAVAREARRVVETYDKVSEARQIADGAQAAVAASAAIEIGAIGLGTLVAILATTASADITGILMATVVAALGLFIIPARRRQARGEMHEKIAELRAQLVTTLGAQFEREIARSVTDIADAIAPYTRFVRAEQGKLQSIKYELAGARENLDHLKARAENI